MSDTETMDPEMVRLRRVVTLARSQRDQAWKSLQEADDRIDSLREETAAARAEVAALRSRIEAVIANSDSQCLYHRGYNDAFPLAARPVLSREALADTLSKHRLTWWSVYPWAGGHEVAPRCTCGVLWSAGHRDDLDAQIAHWEGHLADVLAGEQQ